MLLITELSRQPQVLLSQAPSIIYITEEEKERDIMLSSRQEQLLSTLKDAIPCLFL